MTAPEPTAVERTIAEVMRTHERDGCWDECQCGAGPMDLPMHQSEAVVAAIRNLPPEQMAELVGVTGSATPARDLTPGVRDV